MATKRDPGKWVGEYLYLMRGAEMLARLGEEVDNPGGWALLHRAGVRLEREAMRVLTAGSGGGDGRSFRL